MNEAEWTRAFQAKGALWFHDGGHDRPHVLLPSRRHSNLYFNPENLLKDGRLLNEAARDLVSQLKDAGLNLEDIDLLLSPPRAFGAANDLAWHLSGLISSTTGKPCPRIDVTRRYDPCSQAFERTACLDSQRTLFVEDEIGRNTLAMLGRIAIDLDGTALLFIPALLNVLGGSRCPYNVQLVALVHQSRREWNDEGCPLCAGGSEALRPKDLMKEWRDAA